MDKFESKRGAGRRFAAVLVCAATVMVAPAASWANDDVVMARDAGTGLGSVLATVVYAPTKTVYALGGLLVGGLAYAFSGGDADVARVVLEPSVLGDYVITTEHLRRERPVEFFGRATRADDPAARRYEGEERDVAAAPDGW